MTTSSAAPIPQSAPVETSPLFGGGVVASTWFAFIHLLLNMPLGVAYFVVLVTSVSLGIGLLITLIGIPILIGSGWMVRTLGNIERARMNVFLGTTLRNPYRPAAPDTGWIA